MFPILRLGPLTLQARGLILVVAYWLALTASERAARRLGMRGEIVNNMGFSALIAFLVTARLGYVLQYLPVFLNDPASTIALNLNMLSPMVGIMGSAFVLVWHIGRLHMPVRRLLDALTPGFLILAAGLALVDLASGDGYGAPAQLPWSIDLWGELRHPTQVYDLLAVGVVFAFIWRCEPLFEGARFVLSIALYAASRLFLEAFHGDSATIAGVRIVQVWSLLVLVAARLLLRHWAQPSEIQQTRADPV